MELLQITIKRHCLLFDSIGNTKSIEDMFLIPKELTTACEIEAYGKETEKQL